LTAAVTITWVFRRGLDRRPFLELGLHRTSESAKEIIAGTLLGVGLIAMVFLIEWGAGWVAPEGFDLRGWPSRALVGDLAGWFVLFLCVAMNEELVFRGYVLQNLEYTWGPGAAALLSSAIFALFHGLNPDFGVLGWIGLVGAGLLLAYAYLVTRALWLAMAFHLAWNYAEGPLFSFPVSGLPFNGLLEVRAVGGDLLLTGGNFGPEGGLVGLAAVAGGVAILWAWSRARGRGRGPDFPSP
jgi:membrane protease YdiL (CAAX protease family)